MFYPNIAAERARKKISTEALAKMLNVSRKTIYNWESSGKIPDVALEKMSKIFGCSIDYLLETEDEKT